MLMKKPLLALLPLLFFLFALPAAVSAGTPTDDTVEISDLTWDEESEAYYFSVSIKGSRIYTACNMEITLPEGINVVYDEEDDGSKSLWVMLSEDQDFLPFAKVGKKITFKHNVGSYLHEGNRLRVAVNSNENAEFKANEGELFYVYVTVDESKFNTSFTPKPFVKVTGLAFVVKENAVQYDPADVVCRPFSTDIPADRTLPINIQAKNQVGTIILPFSAALPEGLNAYTCNSVDAEKAGYLDLTPATSFEACKPYIIYAPNGYSGSINGTVDMTADYPLSDAYTEGFLTGLLTANIVNTGYIMQNKGDGPCFYSAEGSAFNLPAGRCYLSLSDAGSKVFGFKFNDSTTGINAVEHLLPAQSDRMYDLTGRRIINPQNGQIFIKNHKKIINTNNSAH